MGLRLSSRVDGARIVVDVDGELDMATSPELDDLLQEIADGGGRWVVLDLADVAFLDSSGLGVLMAWFKDLRAHGGRLCVAAPQDIVAYVLHLSAVDQVLGVYESVAAAEADMPPAVS